ncbi:MAG: hypothetical protein JG765_2404 [Cereibacter sp.]|jgi:hypothetical protein|nr:hypothetical protein [Cereibacter sp.]
MAGEGGWPEVFKDDDQRVRHDQGHRKPGEGVPHHDKAYRVPRTDQTDTSSASARHLSHARMR